MHVCDTVCMLSQTRHDPNIPGAAAPQGGWTHPDESVVRPALSWCCRTSGSSGGLPGPVRCLHMSHGLTEEERRRLQGRWQEQSAGCVAGCAAAAACGWVRAAEEGEAGSPAQRCTAGWQTLQGVQTSQVCVATCLAARKACAQQPRPAPQRPAARPLNGWPRGLHSVWPCVWLCAPAHVCSRGVRMHVEPGIV